MIDKSKLIELLNHPEENIRNAAAAALQNFFSDSTDVISNILDATEKFGRERSAFLFSTLSSFVPTDSDIKRIVALLNSIDPDANEDLLYVYNELLDSLFDFPIKILEKNVSALKELAVYKDIEDFLKYEKKVSVTPPENLWKQLEKLAKKNDGQDFSEDDALTAYSLIKYLTNHKKFISQKFDELMDKDDLLYYTEGFLIELAGKCKLEDKVSSIFDIFLNTDFEDMFHDVCIEALLQIGTEEVVQKIISSYDNGPIFQRASFAGMLGHLLLPSSEEFCLQILEKEKDKECRTFAAISLIEMLSEKAINPIASMLQNKSYDLSVCNLYDELYPVLVYNNVSQQKIKEIASFSEKKTIIHK